MSLYRVGYNHTKKVPGRKRPAWDDTVNDLTVHRATPEEVLSRKEKHKSKNHLSAKLEKLHQERKSKSKLTGVEAQQLAIIKEVLYDQQQLQNVLAKSDTMMAVVKDLFGDDPKRFMGFPNVTTAPSSQDFNNSNSLVASVPDFYTRSEKLSDSIMDQSALNDMESSSDSDDSEVDRPKPISYESKLNLQRFQEYLQEEERKTAHMDPAAAVASQIHRQRPNTADQTNHKPFQKTQGTAQTQLYEAIAAVLNQEQRGKSAKDFQETSDFMAAVKVVALANKDGFKTPPRDERSPPLQCERTPPSAMNDTQKVKKTKKLTNTSSTASEIGNTSSNMNDMRKVLDDLEQEITAYELSTGRRRQREVSKTETFSGYTIALVTAVSRLTRYLKETELRLQTEITLREQLSQDVSQLKTIIDAVATDMIVTQEEYGKLYSEHQRYKQATQNELFSLNNQVKNLQSYVGITESRSLHGARPASNLEDRLGSHPAQDQDPNDVCASNNNIRKSEDSRTSTPIHTDETKKSIDVASQQDHRDTMKLPSMPPSAVMLSPPVRKTRVPVVVNQAHAISVPTKRQTSLIDVGYDLSPGDNQIDPPYLTQAPPVTNTVNVPRPIPLVQSNVNVSLSARQPVTQVTGRGKGNFEAGTVPKTLPVTDLADLVRLEDETEQQMQQLQELVMEEALNNPDLQNLMQTQIAELNRQQEEAKRRLKDLLQHQKLQQQRMQDKFDPHLTENDQRNYKSVSPPISPISQQPEEPQRVKVQSDKLPHQTRLVKVSVPQAEFDESVEQ